MNQTQQARVGRTKRIDWALTQHTGHSSTDMMLVRLASMADDFGLIRMSIDPLAEAMHLSRAVVGAKTLRLIDLGLIETDKTGTTGKKLHYRLCLSADVQHKYPPVPTKRRNKRANPSIRKGSTDA